MSTEQHQNQESSGQVGAAGVETGQQANDQYYGYGFLKHRLQFDPLMIVFVVLLEVGGIIGYVSKGSTASIVTSSIFAILLLGATYIDGVKRNTYPLLILLLVLFCLMLNRAIVNGTFLPAGLVVTLTLVMLLRHSYFVYARRQMART